MNCTGGFVSSPNNDGRYFTFDSDVFDVTSTPSYPEAHFTAGWFPPLTADPEAGGLVCTYAPDGLEDPDLWRIVAPGSEVVFVNGGTLQPGSGTFS